MIAPFISAGHDGLFVSPTVLQIGSIVSEGYSAKSGAENSMAQMAVSTSRGTFVESHHHVAYLRLQVPSVGTCVATPSLGDQDLSLYRSLKKTKQKTSCIAKHSKRLHGSRWSSVCITTGMLQPHPSSHSSTSSPDQALSGLVSTTTWNASSCLTLLAQVWLAGLPSQGLS